MKNNLILFLTGIVTFLLQCTVVQKLAISYITPNLLIILCVSFGLMRGKRCGMFLGFFVGLLADLFFGAIFGVYALIYMYVGYFSGCACKICYDDDIKVPVLLTAVFDLLYNFAVYALQFLLRGRLGLFAYLKRIIIPEMLYTALASVIVYWIYHLINHRLMKQVRKESESIWVLK